jgi:hypothetical protein
MRIALVSPSVNHVEGVPHCVAALGQARSDDHEVHLFAGSFDDTDYGGVSYHKVPALPWGVTSFHATFMATMYLRHALKSVVPGRGFDIVHGAGYTCPYANVVTAHFCQFREQRLLAGADEGAG